MAMYEPNWDQIMAALKKEADADGEFSGAWEEVARICGIPSDVDIYLLFNENKWRFAVYYPEGDGVKMSIPR